MAEEKRQRLYRLARETNYQFRAYMASALTNLEKEELSNLKNLLETIYEEIFHPKSVFLYLPHLWSEPGHDEGLTPEEVNHLDRLRLAESDFLVLCANHPSFGAGQEVEISQAMGLPILVFVQEDVKVSRMLGGVPAIAVRPYDNPEKPSRGIIAYRDTNDLKDKLKDRLQDLIKRLAKEKNHQGHSSVTARLKSFREQKGWSLEDLANKAGFSVAFLQMLEIDQIHLDNVLDRYDLPNFRELQGLSLNLTKYANPGLWVLRRLSDALGVDLGTLLSEERGKTELALDQGNPLDTQCSNLTLVQTKKVAQAFGVDVEFRRLAARPDEVSTREITEEAVRDEIKKVVNPK